MRIKYSKETTYISDTTSYRFPVESNQIPFAALQEATNNFNSNSLIGLGGFGTIYKGVLCDGTKVALKRCKLESSQGIEEFQTEIEMLSHFRHPYLVSLIRYCDDLGAYGSYVPTMTWEQRLEICIGAARGLHYLHKNAVIHRDVKSANILLDENFVAKITDSGVSKTRTELHQTQSLYFEGMVTLAAWAIDSHKKGQLEQIVDPNLAAKIRPESLSKFGETAVKCLADSGVDRPSMGDVLWNLEYALHLQEHVIQDVPEENSTILIGANK